MDEEEDNMESKEIIEDQLVSIISKDYLDVFSEYLILLGTWQAIQLPCTGRYSTVVFVSHSVWSAIFLL